jgi:hypothetical protein
MIMKEETNATERTSSCILRATIRSLAHMWYTIDADWDMIPYDI